MFTAPSDSVRDPVLVKLVINEPELLFTSREAGIAISFVIVAMTSSLVLPAAQLELTLPNVYVPPPTFTMPLASKIKALVLLFSVDAPDPIYVKVLKLRKVPRTGAVEGSGQAVIQRGAAGCRYAADVGGRHCISTKRSNCAARLGCISVLLPLPTKAHGPRMPLVLSVVVVMGPEAALNVATPPMVCESAPKASVPELLFVTVDAPAAATKPATVWDWFAGLGE